MYYVFLQQFLKKFKYKNVVLEHFVLLFYDHYQLK